MKKHFLDFKEMGLIPMNNCEMMDVDGGVNFWKWIGAVVGAAVGLLIAGPVGAFEGAIYGFAIGAAIDLSNGDTTVRFA
jgi:outer membrane lipoprotein SlyB